MRALRPPFSLPLAAPSPLTLALSCDGRHGEREEEKKKKALSQHYPEKHRGGRGTLVDILPIAQRNQRKGRKEGEKKRNVISTPPLKNRRKHTVMLKENLENKKYVCWGWRGVRGRWGG